MSVLVLGFAVACGDDSDSDNGGNGNNNMPGTLTTVRQGTLVADGAGGAPDATGSISVGRDAAGALFVVLGNDFSQEMGPGDTQLIFATGPGNVDTQRMADPASVSVSAGTVPNGFSGTQTFPIPSSINTQQFSHLIVWCPTAGVNFGVAELSGSSQPTETIVRTSMLVADGAGGAPDATGTVEVLRSGAELMIRLGSDFAQEMGPGDTQLILGRTGDNVDMQRSADATSVSMSLGTIPNGATGTRSFTVPGTVDLDAFDYVIVWCPTAGVNFGAAQLPNRSGTLMGDGAGGAPDATGAVTFSRGTSGELMIDLGSDFMQEMGPGDTQVILAAGSGNVAEQRNADANSASPSIGTVPNGATGALSFAIPAGVDVDRFDYAIIWCPTAGVNFGAARLN